MSGHTTIADVRAAGGCLCGAVRFEVRGELDPVENCHCGQCRRFHGHFGAYTSAARDAFAFTADRGLRWFDSSERAQRGFCGICGSSLFWSGRDDPRIDIAAGALDPPTGLETVRHIFVADKGDYYRLDDDLEKLPGESGA